MENQVGYALIVKILITKVSIFLLISIYNLINYIIFINIVRIKCNRCGRGNSNLFNPQNNNCFNVNNLFSTENVFNGDISPISYNNKKDYSFSPIPKNCKAFYKEKGEKVNKKLNKNKKPFIERPGDWICAKCQNLNFAFRTNCNRCHLPKNEKQKNSP